MTALKSFFNLHKYKINNPDKKFLYNYFICLAALVLFSLTILAPYSLYWIYKSGDLALERVVKAQAQGDFIIFGSGISQNFMEYKLELYKNVRPEICVIGSSRVMQFRGAWFAAPFVNMGGVAGNLAELRYALEQMLKISKPRFLIIGLDFWWFMPQWEKEPFKNLDFKQGSYEFDLQKLKKPWQWLFEGKISFAELFKPFLASFGKGFRDDRRGIMAQQYNEGFGPDGSWYNSAELSGKKAPFDYQFSDTLLQIESGIKAFYHAGPNEQAPAETHLAAFAAILKLLEDEAIPYQLFIPPLSQKVYDIMQQKRSFWPHLFNLQKSLQGGGMQALDFSSPKLLNSNDCEFIDGFHGGEIIYARILMELAHVNSELRPYVRIKTLENLVNDWQGHAMSFNVNVTSDPEIDFHHFGCRKKR